MSRTRQLVEQTRDAQFPASDVPAGYVQATPDLVMGSLLQTTCASQLYSACGLPDIDGRRTAN